MTQTAAPTMRKPRRNWRGWMFVGPFLFFFAIVFVAPLLYAIYLSFFQPKMVWGVSQGEQFIGFDNYIKLFTDPNFWSGVIGVGLFLLIQVPIMLIISMYLALAIDSGRLWGSSFFRVSVFLPYAIPAVVATLMWGFMYGTRYGVMSEVNNLFGTSIDFFSPSLIWVGIGNIVTWEFIGYNMLIFYSALKTIPGSLYEAAAIDGASEWNIIRAIKLPAIRGSMMIAMIFSVIGSFQLFNEPNVLQQMAGNTITTYFTPNFYAFHLAFEANNPSYSATLAIVMGVITVAVAYIVQLWGAKGGVK
ncbi:multiple sugar transport system permease protein [Tessaracoccus bendigoensis DSM 12906]|uniref:Multiple sugar transport system permease protein n=1 Tax=Tessaracoccus bendigoensis DSM 12906 TaxID=1123357 RepID=A0A1M6E2U4_9ACTN|nr:sugar ABC transporter permease [Tessaracoccus bendigoensis]SHI79864.1 multiple sugar transport system permease protein [Tessaracoccus bendigoensis DSM 12906]